MESKTISGICILSSLTIVGILIGSDKIDFIIFDSVFLTVISVCILFCIFCILIGIWEKIMERILKLKN